MPGIDSLADCILQGIDSLADCILQGIDNLADCILQGIDSLADCKLPGIDSFSNCKLQRYLGYSRDKYLGIFFVGKIKELCLLCTVQESIFSYKKVLVFCILTQKSNDLCLFPTKCISF